MAKYYDAIKTTMIFNTLDGGFSESHLNITDKDFAAAAASARELALARLACCGNGASLAALRLSDIRSPSGVQVPPSTVPPGTRTFRSQLVPTATTAGIASYRPQYANSNLTGLIPSANNVAVTLNQQVPYGRDCDPDQLQTCLLIEAQAAMRACKWYLAGIPDGISDIGMTGGTNPADKFWLKSFALYRAVLLGIQTSKGTKPKWGFLARIMTGANFVPTPIVAWGLKAGPGTNVVVSYLTAGGPTFLVGMPVQVTGAKNSLSGLPKLNANYTVASLATAGANTVVELDDSAGLTISAIQNKGFITQIDHEVVQYTDVQVGRQVSHKRGRFHSFFRGRTTRR